MNLIHIDENGLHLVFERKEDGTCKLCLLYTSRCV